MNRPSTDPRVVRVLFGALAFVLVARGTAVPGTSGPPPDIPAGSGSQIRPPGPDYRFPAGQKYVYGVEWHLISAGTAVLQMDTIGKEHRVKVTGDSSGVVNMVYTVHDHLETSFDPHTFCSNRYFKHTEEAFRKRDEQVRFDYSRKKAIRDAKNLRNNETLHQENDIPGCVTDVVSGFYYLSSLPLEPNATYQFPLSDGAPTVEVRAHVEGKETVKTKLGTFPAIRVLAEATSGPLKGRGRLWVWYSDDAQRIPLQMRAKLKWGNLSFNLIRIDRP